jgi:putative ABC transport system ATP-binding protein
LSAAGVVLCVRGLDFAYARRSPAREPAHQPGFALLLDALDVAPGEALALCGPSGSGKTTLLQLLAGILVAGRGQVVLDGRDPAALGEAARRRLRLARVGLVLQGLELFEHLSLRENVRLPGLVGARAASAEEVDLALARVGLTGRARARPRALSQGERQRAAVCRALSSRPGLVLVDEPTANLDRANAERVLDLLFDAQRAGATLVVATHDAQARGRFARVLELAEPARRQDPEAAS